MKSIHKVTKFSEINIELSQTFGKKFIIENNHNHTLDDCMFRYYTAINKIKFKTLYERNNILLRALNVKESENYYKVAPLTSRQEFLKDFRKILLDNDISSYFFEVLPERYRLTRIVTGSKYDHVNTSTGRMKITAGKNYLTMKKKDRKVIKVKDNHTLYEIDVKSCEPAFLHHVLYGETSDDIYSLFSTDDIARGKIKIAVISSLYGATNQKVKNLSGMSDTDIKAVHDHFQLKKIKKSIIDEHSKRGKFYNLYGRPIYDIKSPVNYWLQSSSADYCCLAFLNLVKNYNLDLVAVIHDAITEGRECLQIQAILD